jgi:hypothetical protein
MGEHGQVLEQQVCLREWKDQLKTVEEQNAEQNGTEPGVDVGTV